MQTNGKMLLPWITEVMLPIGRAAIEKRGLSVLFLAAFLALDCWVLWRLSRSSGSRVLREVWSGIVVLVPSVFLCAFTLATIAPYVKVVEGWNRPSPALDAPERALNHNQLGIILQTRGNLEGATRCYRTALDLDPNYAEAHCNLGLALQARGKFAEALAALKLGHEIGSRRKDWRYPSAEWVKSCETFLALNARLPAYLRGEAKPKDLDEQLVLARLCQEHKKLYAAAARFYAAAFAAEPKLAENVQQPNRYNAACAAALAGCGRGSDVAELDDRERARLRQQALSWLRADLVALDKLVTTGRHEDRALVQQRMRHWLQDPDFLGVRGDAVRKLPEAEREGWRRLWQDVEGPRDRAADGK